MAGEAARLTLFQQFKHLHEEELFDSLCDFGDLILTSETRPKNCASQRELFRVAKEEFRCLVLYAHALLKEHRYRQAIDVYSRVCSMLYHTHPPPGSAGKIGGRSLTSPKVEMPCGTTGFERIFTEDDIKYRFALAHMGVDDQLEAMAVLETIPPASRSSKVLSLMAKISLVRQNYAADKLKQIIKQTPMALRVLDSWFMYGGKLTELNANLGKSVAEERIAAVLSKLVHAHSYIATGNYQPAYQTLQSLQDDPLFVQNPRLMTLQAKCQSALGNTEKAIRIFSSIDHGHPNFYRGLDEYAALLFEQGDGPILHRLSDRLLKCASLSPEAWVSKGYSSLYRKDISGAAKFTEHAIALDNEHQRAYVLKGQICLRKEDYYGAQKALRHALDLCPHSMDAYKHLVDVYGRRYGEKESIAIASTMFKVCRKNPRSMHLYADVCIRHNHRLRDTIVQLEKHLKVHPRDHAAAIHLACAFDSLKSPQQAIDVLKNQLKYGPRKDVHLALARLYKSVDDPAKEAEHNSLADSFPLANDIDPRADSPPPGPSSGFRDASDSPRPATPNDEDGGNEPSGADDDEDEDSVME